MYNELLGVQGKINNYIKDLPCKITFIIQWCLLHSKISFHVKNLLISRLNYSGFIVFGIFQIHSLVFTFSNNCFFVCFYKYTLINWSLKVCNNFLNTLNKYKIWNLYINCLHGFLNFCEKQINLYIRTDEVIIFYKIVIGGLKI